MKKFEYKICEVPQKPFLDTDVDVEKLMEELNALGAEGWEATSSVDQNQNQGTLGTKLTIIILKREIQ